MLLGKGLHHPLTCSTVASSLHFLPHALRVLTLLGGSVHACVIGMCICLYMCSPSLMCTRVAGP